VNSTQVNLTFSTRTKYGWNTIEATQTPSGLIKVKHLSNDTRLNKSVLRFRLSRHDYMLWLDYNTISSNIMLSSNHKDIIKDSIRDTDISIERMLSSMFIVFIGSFIFGGFLAGAGLIASFAVIFIANLLKLSPKMVRISTLLVHTGVAGAALVTMANPNHLLAAVFPQLFSHNGVLIGYIILLSAIAYWVSESIIRQRAIKDNIGKYLAFGLTYMVYLNFGIAVYISLYNVVGKI